MASLVDQLRDRWEGITPRERKLVLLLGATFVVCIVLWLGYSIRDGLDSISKRNGKMRQALVVLQDMRVHGRQKPAGEDLTSRIPTDPVKLETYLGKAADSVSLRVPSFNPRTPVVKNGYTTYTMQIELRDLDINQAKDLLQAIESGNPMVMVTSLDVNRNFRDKEKLDLKLEISTYAKTPDKGEAAPGSGSGSVALPEGG